MVFEPQILSCEVEKSSKFRDSAYDALVNMQ